MRRWRRLRSPFGLVLLAGLLGACASDPAPEAAPEPDLLEQNALNAIEIGADYLVPDALAAARTRFEALDDLAGQWRIARLEALYALGEGNPERIRATTARLEKIRQLGNLDRTGGYNVDFETELILARAAGGTPDFDRALAAAERPIERAVALAWQGDTRAAMAELAAAGQGTAADRAFVNYRHGRATDSAPHLETALELFRQAGDSRAIADTLFSLAQLARDRGDIDAARGFAERARVTLAATGDANRSRAVKAWLERL